MSELIKPPRIEIAPGYDICRIVKGNWQLTPDHLRIGSLKNVDDIVEDLKCFVEKGFTTFDVADIYTGAEELIGQFNTRYKNDMQNGGLPSVQIHTKYVPDKDTLATLQFEDTEAIIDRSLKRLNVDRLDLVQFHWWDLGIDRYAEVATYLGKLQEKGKIRHIGVTNFDHEALGKIVNAGVKITSAQVQYSVLDRRPAGEFTDFCKKNDISMLCYGSVAGGFLSDRYLGVPEPTQEASELQNRSLTKYRLIIEEFGGWDLYQQALTTLKSIGEPNGLSVSETAILYTLSNPGVAGAIVGARNSDHLHSLCNLTEKMQGNIDFTPLDKVFAKSTGLSGKVYHLERYSQDHKSIMKTKLNQGDESFD